VAEYHQLWVAVFLGMLEGLTEFIPVSSTGHLIICESLTKFPTIPGKLFEIVVQVGAILAICILYFKKILRVITTLPHDKGSQYFVRNIITAFIPAAVVGVLLHAYILEYLFHPLSVATSLITGGLAIIIVEQRRHKPRYLTSESLPASIAFLIGCAQILAMIPGISRSGATIVGALLAKMERAAAAEFSFFLAIPTILGASVYSLFKNWNDIDDQHLLFVIVGGVCAFFTALLIVKWVINFVSKRGFMPFAIYRILLGCAVILWYQQYPELWMF
jgi:undecaprenyl-diphosphatase